MFGLTTPQKNIWNLQKFYEGTSISNNCGAIFFENQCDHRLLNQAINKLIELQSGMRLRFREEDGHPVQYLIDYQPEQFPSKHFESKAAFEEYAHRYALTPFNLIDSPMYRFVIFDLDGKTGVLLCANHLISDAWAISIIANTVYNWYHALASGQTLEAKEYSFIPMIEEEQDYFCSPKYKKDQCFWTEQYFSKPEVSAIKTNSAPAAKPTAKRLTKELSSELTAAIDLFRSKNNVSQAVLFEAAIITYLSLINPENSNITLGVLVLNRFGAQKKRIVGNCISTVPLTVSVREDQTAAQLCDEITTGHYKLFRHQRFPYSHILHDLRERYDFSGNLYDVLVSFQNAKTGAKAKTKWYSNGYCEVPLEIHIDNRDNNAHYILNVDYQTELFCEEEISLLIERILFILSQIINNPGARMADISIMPETEYQKVIFEFNQTSIPYQKNKCVHELFAEQAAKYPDKTALVFEEKCFTYRKLDEMSNSLAHYLRRKGIAPGSIVPIVSKRSWHVIVAMLGILKAGGAYMHVDISYPEERIAYMLETAESIFGLTYGYTKPLGIETISLENFDYACNCSPLSNSNHPSDLCYVIFTSGSTGKPKGLMIAHNNVVNFAAFCPLNVFGAIIPDAEHSILAISSTAFDMSVTETLLPLMDGITIYFANDEQTLSQAKLAKFFKGKSIHTLETTPTKMRILISDKSNLNYLESVEAFILGGEALPYDLYKELREISRAKIYNNYGPAETTVWSTIKEMVDDDITIGKPIANTQVYILDANRKPLPIGVAGELCISGDGVGKGYLNRPELTAERFIPNPFISGTTMYCTGDLARWRADGEIEYLGRMDTQVKIRGLRIELGEIESVMNGFDSIRLAAVTDKRDETGRQYLVGYYTSEAEIDEKELRRHLGAKLPKYMVPNYFVHLSEMPMTASGKIDRKNLPVPEFTVIERKYVAPVTEQEKILCDLLEELFQLEKIGTSDDFFELGGDSLRAIEYVAKAHNAGVSFALQNVFDYPTVHQLCDYLCGGERVKVEYAEADFEKYESLLSANVIDSSFVPVRKSLGNVFLTGATGFLGSHIVDQFMKAETGKLYCLVRGGKDRLASTLKYYFGDIYDSQLGSRIIVLDGDITKDTLGETLPDDIQTVIHTAATVKHYGSYDYFHGVNVQGTRNVIAFAQRRKAKLIHVSTLSVSGNSLVDAFDIYHAEQTMEFSETSLYIGQPLDNVYIHSKFEAELAVLDAALDGLDAKIIRVGNLTNRASDFKFQPNYQSNAFLTRVKASLEFGYLPDYLLPLYAEFSPIDQTAEGIVKIAQYAGNQTVFHLNSNRNLYFGRMIEIMNALGIKLEAIDGEVFSRMLQQLSRNADTEYIYEAFQNDMDETGKLVYDSNIYILNDFTIWFMKKLGFAWAEIDYDYVKGYVEYFRKLGYFKA